MSSPLAAEGPAAWEHGLTPVVLKRLRILISPFDTPATLAFDPERYALLCRASPGKWGDVLARYALFQRLRRREGEAETDHRRRQDRWLAERRQWEQEQRTFSLGDLDVRRMLAPDPSAGAFIAFGASIASPEQIAGSKLESTCAISATGRVLVLDVASDKVRLMARISELIDHEREASGIVPATRRGPKTLAEKKLAEARCRRPASEHREFLQSIQSHQLVPLWDLQLAGLTTDKATTASVLYPERANPARNVLPRSIPRVLLQKIDRARELQDQTVGWLPRLRAVVG